MNFFDILLVLCTVSGAGLPCVAGHCIEERCTQSIHRLGNDMLLLERFVRYPLSGYRRISDKTLLEHEKRKVLYDLITRSPGIDVKELVQFSGFNENTLRYHITLLEKNNKIRITHENGILHLFENHGKYSDFEQKSISLHRTPRYVRIIGILQKNPGITRGELADMLGVSGPSVTKYMQILIDEHLVVVQKDRKYTRYVLIDPHKQGILTTGQGNS